MSIEDLVPILIPAAFAGFALLERLRPARPLPRVRGWRMLGLATFVVTGVVSSALPMLYQPFIEAHRLLDLEGLGLAAGTAIAFLVTELSGYWLHRLRHTPVLWSVHQFHHSAERLDVFGSAYFHPLDIGAETLVGSLTSTLVLGVSGEAAALAGIVSVFLSIFQHTNVRTPRWLGYVIQRPESHSVHHARGVHAFNYANLPLWDMVFGTFRNPERFEAEAGFYDGASRRVGAMLLLRDVTRPAAERRDAQPARA
jgi:sterol desaturase/sphingolipid hydroxylase (fatty acid hydroxylase superfamily)